MSDVGMSTYLTPEEAKEFHKLFMFWFGAHTAIAVENLANI